MSKTEPFQLTHADVQRAGLAANDVGMWCLIVDGAYHLFGSETQARRAHAMMLQGQFVR